MTREFFAGPHRPRDSLIRLSLLGVSHHASTALFLPRRCKLPPNATSHSRLGLSPLARVYSSLRYTLPAFQVQPHTCYNRCGTLASSDTKDVDFLTTLSPRMDCTAPTLVDKGFRCITNVSLDRAYQLPPLPRRSYGPWHGHGPRDTLVHGRQAILSLRGGGIMPPPSGYFKSKLTGRILHPPLSDPLSG
jgi:hypothetical protein